MARGGRRTYVRDSRGRFASTPGGGAQAKGGTLGARSSLKKSRSKLASKDSTDQSLRGTLSRRSQKGAVTRGSKALKDAKASSRKSLNIGKPGGTIGKKRGAKASAKPVKQKQKPNVKKVALTKQELQDRLFEKQSKTRKNKHKLKETRNEKQIQAWKNAEQNKEGFYGVISTQARRLKKGGMPEDQAWAKAFKDRPRYSTRQKVKVNWGVRQSRLLHQGLYG